MTVFPKIISALFKNAILSTIITYFHAHCEMVVLTYHDLLSLYFGQLCRRSLWLTFSPHSIILWHDTPFVFCHGAVTVCDCFIGQFGLLTSCHPPPPLQPMMSSSPLLLSIVGRQISLSEPAQSPAHTEAGSQWATRHSSIRDMDSMKSTVQVQS